MKSIHCGILVDGRRTDPVSDAVINVDDGDIVAVGPREEVSVPDSATVIDHSDRTVMPGLIDAHVHLDGWREHDPVEWVKDGVPLATARAVKDAETLLANGFTTVRDVGSRAGLGLREAIAEGTVDGPRVFTSERLISQTAGHGDIHFFPHEWVAEHPNWIGILADGEDECRKATRKLVRKGVDLIKIMTTGGVLSEKDSPYHDHMTDAEIQAVTEEAHRVGIPVASHAEGTAGIKSALRNGVDTIEHGFGMDEECIELIHETGGDMVPTLSVLYQYLDIGEEVGVPEYAMEKIQDVKSRQLESVRRADDADVPIALGTDFSGSHLAPHGDNAMEAELLVEEVGMAPADVLRAGTSVAADVIGTDDVGVIEVGRQADLLVTATNPLEDISTLRDPLAVYKGGHQV